MFKAVRIAFLLMVLVSVWTTLQLQRDVSRDWQGTVDVTVIPIVADDQAQTKKFVAGLRETDFAVVDKFLVAQAKRFNRDLEYAFNVTLAEPIDSVPPLPPQNRDARFAIMLWSLKLRWWAWRNQNDDFHSFQIRLFVLYQSPDRGELLPHSTGLQNGLLGLIHARAQPEHRRHNNVVLVHELLHIFGASDKYDLSTGRPIYPEGYLRPSRQYPQRYAEIMARSIPISDTEFRVAERLSQTKVGKTTAIEIGWLTDQ